MIKFLTNRINIIFFIVLIFVIFVSTANICYSNNKIIATVNGKPIKADQIAVIVNKKIPMTSFHSRISPEKMEKIQNEALQELIEEELLYQEAKRQKLTVKPSELEGQIALMKSGYPTEKEFQQALTQSGLNLRTLKKRITRSLLIQKIQQQEIFDKVVLDDADLRDYYEANKEKFVKPEQRRVLHILISVNPGAMVEGWKAGLKQAEQIYSRIMAGEDFAKLAKEISADSSSRENGGDIGWFHKGQLIPELEQALDSMKIGEVSPPIRSIYGFHIIRYEETKPAKQLSFDEINLSDLRKRLKKRLLENRRQEFLASLKAASNIKIYKQ